MEDVCIWTHLFSNLMHKKKTFHYYPPWMASQPWEESDMTNRVQNKKHLGPTVWDEEEEVLKAD